MGIFDALVAAFAVLLEVSVLTTTPSVTPPEPTAQTVDDPRGIMEF